MLESKIVYFEEFYKFVLVHVFIGVISFRLFIKNVFLKIENVIFPPKYRRCGKFFRSNIIHFEEFYKFFNGHDFIGVISFRLFIKNVFLKIENSIFPAK